MSFSWRKGVLYMSRRLREHTCPQSNCALPLIAITASHCQTTRLVGHPLRPRNVRSVAQQSFRSVRRAACPCWGTPTLPIRFALYAEPISEKYSLGGDALRLRSAVLGVFLIGSSDQVLCLTFKEVTA